MKRLVIVAVLVFALLVTLIACNNNKNPEETTDATTTKNEETTTTAGTTKGDETTGEVTTNAEETTVAEETTNAEETTIAEETTAAEETTEEEVTTEDPKPADGIYATDDAEAQWKHTSFDECEARDAADTELKKAFAPGSFTDLPEVFEVPVATASIRFWGWLATNAKVVAVGYQIDGGDVAFNDAFLVEAEQGVIDAAAGAGASNATRYRTYADVSGVSAGEHTVACIYKLEDGTLVRYIEIKINKAAPEVKEIVKGENGLISADSYKENGEELATGSAYKWLGENRANGISGVANATFRGWVGLNDYTIVGFGYQIGDGKLVLSNTEFSVDFSNEEHKNQVLAIQANAVCYEFTISLADLEPGTYELKLYALASDGNLYNLMSKWGQNTEGKLLIVVPEPYEAPINNVISATYFGEGWAAAGYDCPVSLFEYNGGINLGELDLSKYTKVTIMYGFDGSEVTKNNFDAAGGHEIGLKSVATSYGVAGDPSNMEGEIAHTDMEFSDQGWAGGQRAAVIDLSTITYNGQVYLFLHSPQGTQIAITSIIFE